jgi:hypothetical protein
MRASSVMRFRKEISAAWRVGGCLPHLPAKTVGGLTVVQPKTLAGIGPGLPLRSTSS